MRVNTMTEQTIRDIGRAFGTYDYGGEIGLVNAFDGREGLAKYNEAYVRGMLNGGFLHTNGIRGEAYIAYKLPGERLPLRTVWPVALSMLRHMRLVRFGLAAMRGGQSLEDQLNKKKEPYIFVGLVCVRQRYQGQGYMRKVMDIAFAEGNRLGVPVILETDAISKRDKYIHLGMTLAGTRDLGEFGMMYDLIKYPDAAETIK